MKKISHSITVFLLFLVFCCSPRKNGFTNRKFQEFITYYNTLFNGKETMIAELEKREKVYKDDFHAPFIRILKNAPPIFDSLYSEILSTSKSKGFSLLDLAEVKAEKAIKNHSMLFGGIENNRNIFDAHILLARVKIYQNKPFEALDALNYILNHMKKDKRIDLARIYQGLTYAQMKDYYSSNEIFQEIDQNRKLRKKYRKLLSIYYAEMLAESGEKEKAAEQAEKAFAYNKSRELRGRISYFRGQLLKSLEKSEEAKKSFALAYKYAKDGTLKIKSRIEMMKIFHVENDSDYEQAKKYFKKIIEKEDYTLSKGEIYYEMGLMAKKVGRSDEANLFFRKSGKEEKSDPEIRGMAYTEIGNYHFSEKDYRSAKIYFDSALTVTTYKPFVKRLEKLSKNTGDISKNYYLIKKNDSILNFFRTSDAERKVHSKRYTEKSEKEEKDSKGILNEEKNGTQMNLSDPKKIFILKKESDTARLGLGMMYQKYFGYTALANETLYRLLELDPEEKIKKQALYQIFIMNYEKNNEQAKFSKEKILKEFPRSALAKFVENPKDSSFSKPNPEVQGSYEKAYKLYEEERFSEAINLINDILEKYPYDILVPKLYLLDAFIRGKTNDKETMLLKLENIISDYPKTEEAKKAEKILSLLKKPLTEEDSPPS